MKKLSSVMLAGLFALLFTSCAKEHRVVFRFGAPPQQTAQAAPAKELTAPAAELTPAVEAAQTQVASTETAPAAMVASHKAAAQNFRKTAEAKSANAEVKQLTKAEQKQLKKELRHALKQKKSSSAAGEKSQLIALLLCFFVGSLGIHRFYLGYIWQGVVQLLTLGGLGIWVLIDFIRIIIGDLKPKDGEYDQTL